jgi:hypothetical protein
MYQYALWVTVCLLILIAVIELWNPRLINEGFSNLVSVGESQIWANWMPRRGDVGLSPTEEEPGYHRDIRYFAGYTDVQRLGQDHDFCRMVLRTGGTEDKDLFFACALGGTEGLSTIKYSTKTIKDGFEVSRDDYMNKGYCRILKTGESTFEAKCNALGDSSFAPKLSIDGNPPPNIQTLLTFYSGIMFWLRFRDDIKDYAKNLTVSNSGRIEIDEVPNVVTRGLSFNGKDQFLRLGDSRDMSFGNVIQLKYLRAVSFWVYFDEFTNNAKIYDFGNGAGNDNVVCGIMGRGNEEAQLDVTVTKTCTDQEANTVPSYPSGQQCVIEQSPQTVLFSSSGDVERWDCPKAELFGRIMPPLHSKAAPKYEAKTADLIYEIWEKKQRKLHIQAKNVFSLKKWTHIVITATNNDAFKPGLKIYKDSKLIYTEPSAFLPQTNHTTNNYVGKSNWANMLSGDANADELFRGKLFDFRGYNSVMTDRKIKDTYKWGASLLGMKQKREIMK